MDSGTSINQWQIDFWDVGQGDATTIRHPDGTYTLIDVGPKVKPSILNPLVQWFSQASRGIIRNIVITHNDMDHVGGLYSLLCNPSQAIRRVLLVRDKSMTEIPPQFAVTLQKLKELHEAGKTKTEGVEEGKIIEEDNFFRLVVRYPALLDAAGVQPNNKVSAIITLEHKVSNAVLVIWGGDARLNTIATHCKQTSPSVLVGPHHGAPQDKAQTYKTSLEQLNPKCIFISVGHYAHHPQKRYIHSAINLGCAICCSEVTEQCLSPTRTVFQGSGRLGLPVPHNSTQCRGTMRVIADSTGIHHDEHQEEFLIRTRNLTTALCYSGSPHSQK